MQFLAQLSGLVPYLLLSSVTLSNLSQCTPLPAGEVAVLQQRGIAQEDPWHQTKTTYTGVHACGNDPKACADHWARADYEAIKLVKPTNIVAVLGVEGVGAYAASIPRDDQAKQFIRLQMEKIPIWKAAFAKQPYGELHAEDMALALAVNDGHIQEHHILYMGVWGRPNDNFPAAQELRPCFEHTDRRPETCSNVLAALGVGFKTA